jgi:taurine dioxygenase
MIGSLYRMANKAIEVHPIAGALGAEISGVDLSKPLDERTFDAVHQALLDHLVIFFRDQTLTPREQLVFARRFGGIHLHPYVKGLPDFPEVMPVIKEVGDTRTFGAAWHTDQMFTAQPAMGTMLYARVVPPVGGDTLYANMYLAYDALSDGMKAMLGKLNTFSVGDRFKQAGGKSRAQRYAGTSKMGEHLKDPGNIQTESAHPLIRTHPETGRKALYIGSHAQRFEHMSDAESTPLLEFLKAHAVRPEFTCRFSWAEGSLAFWDNRCTQHFAIGDYDGHRREMHRVTIAGDVPF